MHKVKAGFTLLALLLPLLLSATHLLKNDLLNIKASKLIDDMGDELFLKTGVNVYVIATNEHFQEGYNLVTYSKKYDANMSKPYVLFIFAPYATIIKDADTKGRVGIIPSSPEIKSLYHYDDVRDAAIDVVASKDANTDEDKFNIGIVQGYSELADNIAASKGIKLENTIPNNTGTVINILRVFVYFGSIIVLWVFILRPLVMRIKHGKK